MLSSTDSVDWTPGDSRSGTPSQATLACLTHHCHCGGWGFGHKLGDPAHSLQDTSCVRPPTSQAIPSTRKAFSDSESPQLRGFHRSALFFREGHVRFIQ